MTTRDTDPLNDVLTFGQPHDAPANCAEGNALDAIPLIPVESLYELLEPLGEGGMGTVTKARKRGLPRMVAVKRMQQDCRNSAVSQLRFIQEAIAVAQLNHPNIVHIEHWGRDSEGPYLILEYLSGKDLAHYVGQNGPLSAARISEIACCLCDALQHAHSRNIIHRDIKPHNLLLSEHGLVKLTDFGLVRTLTGNSELSQPGRLLGSLPYMAPEQRDDPRSADMRSDIFSLAASLYHLAVGQPPPVSMNFDFARLDPGLLGPLQTGLQSDPLRRWQSAEEFREAFLNAAVRNTVPGSVSSVPQIHRSDGQCSHCHAINPSDRLYCRGCGQSLRQPCLHCDVLIAIWERFCPQCGSNQDTLYGQLREQIEEIRQRSEQLLADYSCAETIVLVEQALSTYSHPQLSQYLLWTGSLRERAEMRQQEVQTAHVEARAIVETLADYDAAISRLDQFPPQARPAAYDDYVARRDRLRELQQEFDAAVATLAFPAAQRAADEIRRLTSNQQSYTEQLAELAQQVYLRGRFLSAERSEFIAARDLLTGVPESLRSPAHLELVQLLQRIVAIEERAVNAISRQQVRDLDAAIRELYQICPEHPRSEEFQKELKRIVHDAHLVIRDIADKEQDFAKAKSLLYEIPGHLRYEKLAGQIHRRRSRVVKLEGAIRECQHQLNWTRLRELAEELLRVQSGNSVALAAIQTSIREQRKARRPPALHTPFDAEEARRAQEAWATFLGCDQKIVNDAGLAFCLIPPGRFLMGSPTSEASRNHEPLHPTIISHPFLLSTCCVSQSLWRQVTNQNPAYFPVPPYAETAQRIPVEQVSWNDCLTFLQLLNQQFPLSGMRYRFPTEAEWEFACRAGTQTAFWFGDRFDGTQGNCRGTYPPTGAGRRCSETSRTSPGDTYQPNAFGLHDMHGNLREWCQDWFREDYYDHAPVTDPAGPDDGSSRVLRGGGWDTQSLYARSACRSHLAPDSREYSVGLRVACEWIGDRLP